MLKFKYGDKVVGIPEYRKQFGNQISGKIEGVIIVDEDGAVVKVKCNSGESVNLDQDWLILDPCETCALGRDGVCKDVEE